MVNQKQAIGKVIITHGRSLQSLVAAQSLGTHGVEVIGCDSTPMMTLSFSKYVKDTFLHAEPETNRDQYLKDLKSNIQRLKPSDNTPYLLMPIHSNTRLIAEHKHLFQNDIKVTTPNFEAIQKVFPKHNLVKTAREYEIQIPATQIIRDESDLISKAEEIGYPVFLKVPDGSGGKGLIKADHPDELQTGYEKIKKQSGSATDENPMLLQEGVEGDDFCCSGLFKDGELVTGMVHYNIQRFPYEGGFGVVRETIPAEPLLEISKRLMKPLKWTGVAQLDYRWNGGDESDAYLIEINPRFFASLFHTVESGIDYPWLLYQLLVEGKPDSIPSPEIGVRTKIPVLSTLSAVEESLQDNLMMDKLHQMWNTFWKPDHSSLHDQTWLDFIGNVKTSLTGDNPYHTFQQLMEDNKSAKKEFLSSDDPMVSFGVLYVLGSLIRYGKLPDEFNR